MKCPKCNGSGDIPRPNGTKLFGLTEVMTCDLCHGNGEVEMTNEEWLKSMDTEQFAEALAWIEDRGELPTVRKENIKAFEKWLKEVHKE